MKIIYVVDVHENYAAVTKAVTAAGTSDLLIVGGDITTAGTVDEAASAVEAWRPLATRLLAVAGNMDSAAIDARLAALGVAIDGRGVAIGDVGFFGVSAGPKSPLHTPYEITEEQIAERIETGFAEVKNCRVKIFCPHAPPKDTACDRIHSGLHVGSTAVRAFIEREQPDLVLCGHIHESRGEDCIGKTRVANPGPVSAGHHAVVEVGETLTVRLV
ncbi:MAG: metallophosphoesterase family protein [Verrucomicrobia bacterium]|nr:metallophosphoesterase family protein [Verrucomicrobiota bacterium]